MRLRNWSAIPSGGKVTVNGTCADTLRVVKLRGVERIESGTVPGGWFRPPTLVVQAVMADGARHTLA